MKCAFIALGVLTWSIVLAGAQDSLSKRRLFPFCKTDSDCDEIVETCRNAPTGICGCRNGTYFSVESHRCFHYAHKVCDDKQPRCSQHSECRETGGLQTCILWFCERSALFTCECLDTYYKGASRLCVHGWNETCSTHDDCDDQFQCDPHRGRCACPSGSVYVENSRSCRVPHDGWCNVRGCLETMRCETGFYWGLKICKCPQGSSLVQDDTPSASHYCTLDYNSPCNFTFMDKHEFLQCNAAMDLTCRSGSCQCDLPGQIFDKVNGYCFSLEGGPCKVFKQGLGNMTNTCVSGTFCEPLLENPELGVCNAKSLSFYFFSWMVFIASLVFGVGVMTLFVWIHCVYPWLKKVFSGGRSKEAEVFRI